MPSARRRQPPEGQAVPNVRFEPLTGDLWPAFEELFGRQGACYGCWCTYFRLPPAARKAHSGEQRKAFMRERIEIGPAPGLLAMEDGRAVGWMQVGPRGDVPEWNNAGRVSAPLAAHEAQGAAVWAVSCFFVRTSARGAGIMHRLVAAGIDYARSHGAVALDACPIRQSRDSRSVGLFVGSARVFEKAGFATLVERKAGRPLMRLEL
ncbi:MAG: GNAT family N-acetyltransferase [Rhizobiaceae bacterium]|nr:GNAT family N-acetyltransferase [Rhizobiaceae bacterium]